MIEGQLRAGPGRAGPGDVRTIGVLDRASSALSTIRTARARTHDRGTAAGQAGPGRAGPGRIIPFETIQIVRVRSREHHVNRDRIRDDGGAIPLTNQQGGARPLTNQQGGAIPLTNQQGGARPLTNKAAPSR